MIIKIQDGKIKYVGNFQKEELQKVAEQESKDKLEQQKERKDTNKICKKHVKDIVDDKHN